MARKKAHEEHANHEAWAIPYADLMTLLLAFFVVMYAVSSLNEGKYKVMAEAMTAAFGGPPKTVKPIEIGKTQLQGSDFDRPAPMVAGARSGASSPAPASPVTRLAAMASQMDFALDARRMQQAQRQLESLSNRLEEALQPLVDKKLIVIKRADLWLEVQINSDILFAPGSATLDPEARGTIATLADVLGGALNPVRVEGYTDNLPINTFQFPSNWELSAARAASVVHLFSDEGIVPERLAMIGYGEYRPVADNATVDGRNTNRRVLLVILASEEAMSETTTPLIADAPPTPSLPATAAAAANATASATPLAPADATADTAGDNASGDPSPVSDQQGIN